MRQQPIRENRLTACLSSLTQEASGVSRLSHEEAARHAGNFLS